MRQQIETPYGSIVYQDIGQGLPIIFLHGVLSNANTWHQVIEPLAQHYRCIVPTLPLGAHEIALGYDAPITGDVITGIIDALANHLQLQEFALLGNDTGGAYAQIFASQHMERVSHLILTNCDAFEVFPPKLFSNLKLGVQIPFFTSLMGLLFRSPFVAQSKLALGALSQSLDGRSIQAHYLDNFMKNDAVRQDFKQVVHGFRPQDTIDAAEALQAFSKPVLILWGAEDKDLFPLALGHRLADIFTDVRFEIVENASTYIQEDNPQSFIQGIVDFLPMDIEEHNAQVAVL